MALLIETRPLPHLPALLLHFISVLPLSWVFRFVGSTPAIEVIESSAALQHFVRTGKLIISDLPDRYPVNTQEDLSATLTDLSFYEEALAPAEWLLVFQGDSIVCAAAEHDLDMWVAHDYTWVGAPWHPGNPSGGNGGLSLRHVPQIISLLKEETREAGSEWEDRWLCDRLGPRETATMPSPAIERLFSVESLWSDRPFGYHLRGSGHALPVEIWGNQTLKSHILEYCPEIKIVLDMDLV